MIDKEMRKELKNKVIHNQYLLMSNEPILIENSINAIQDAMKLDKSFDLDVFSATETGVETIVERLSVSPFTSPRRLVIVKDIDQLVKEIERFPYGFDKQEKNGDLKKFADAINSAQKVNCLVMSFLIDRGLRSKNYNLLYKKISAFFARAQLIIYPEEKGQVRAWIMAKIKREKLELSPVVIEYLESEFRNDITGLKNEFDKIKSYLFESKQLGASEIRDLAIGVCDHDRDLLIEAYLMGKPEAVNLFEEMKLYMKHYTGLIDGLVRGTLKARDESKITEPRVLRSILEQLQNLDRKMKTSSYFDDLHMELFFVQNMTLTRKGGVYGR